MDGKQPFGSFWGSIKSVEPVKVFLRGTTKGMVMTVCVIREKMVTHKLLKQNDRT